MLLATDWLALVLVTLVAGLVVRLALKAGWQDRRGRWGLVLVTVLVLPLVLAWVLALVSVLAQ